jgi:RNA polymerase sigma factor (sigma-70 family)
VTPKSLIEPARHAGTTLLRSQTDQRLVDLTRGGNERAFEAIVQRYRRPLLRYCARLLPSARTEDAVQQAFLSAHRAIHAGDSELNLRPWLYRIAHNASLNLLRQHGFDHEQVSEEIDGVETPPQAFERGEQLRTVVAAVRDLPDRQRSAIVLQALEGRSYDEIAAELGVTDGAVRQLLNRARNTLREAAAALTPTGLITRIASNGGEAGIAERVAQAVAGAGGGAIVVKAGTALIVAGAVAGGAVNGGLPGTGGAGHRHGAGASAAAAVAAQPSGVAGAGSSTATGGGRIQSIALTSSGGRSASKGTGSSGGGTGNRGSSHGNGVTGNRGGRQGGGPGSGGGDNSGSSGSGGGGSSSDDHSGSGHDSSGSSGSGSGHGSDDSSSSGSGSSGSGSSGSDSSGSDSSHSGSGHGSDDTSVATPTPAPAPVTTPSLDSSGKGSSGSGKSGDSEPPDDPPPTEPSHSGKN